MEAILGWIFYLPEKEIVNRERERDRERQTERDRQTETERETDRQTEREREIQTDRQRERGGGERGRRKIENFASLVHHERWYQIFDQEGKG